MARRIHPTLIVFAAAVLVQMLPVRAQSSAAARPRVVITADPELDDTNTLIRALLYSSDSGPATR